MPRIAFIGVRISCDMLERNSDLAREAASAASRATISSRSVRLSVLMSLVKVTAQGSPLSSTIAPEIRHGRTEPSLS